MFDQITLPNGLRVVGEKRTYAFTPKQHFEVGEGLGLMDFETASKLSGARFVVVAGTCVLGPPPPMKSGAPVPDLSSKQPVKAALAINTRGQRDRAPYAL